MTMTILEYAQHHVIRRLKGKRVKKGIRKFRSYRQITEKDLDVSLWGRLSSRLWSRWRYEVIQLHVECNDVTLSQGGQLKIVEVTYYLRWPLRKSQSEWDIIDVFDAHGRGGHVVRKMSLLEHTLIPTKPRHGSSTYLIKDRGW